MDSAQFNKVLITARTSQSYALMSLDNPSGKGIPGYKAKTHQKMEWSAPVLLPRSLQGK